MDIKTSEARSKNMSAIKCKNTKPELKLRKHLFDAGLRYRVKTKVMGKPDIVFLGKKIAIFVDGCFWHGCPDCYKPPESNSEFWGKKLIQNKERDEKVTSCLTAEGWLVLRFWEHDIDGNIESVFEIIRERLKSRTKTKRA